jgi:hypothetical protein
MLIDVGSDYLAENPLWGIIARGSMLPRVEKIMVFSSVG